MFPPIEITLYDPKTEEIIEVYQRNMIPWGLLKKAIGLQKQMGQAEAQAKDQKKWWEWWKSSDVTSPEEAQMRAISQFVVELFGNKFSVKQLEDGADMGEIMTVFRSVIARANASVKLNPTPRPLSKK